MSVYTAIKGIANERKISVYKIERDLQLTNGVISHWDKSMPRADSLQSVADYLGVTSSFILNKARQKEGK
ncbi:XRE family transcriptional regulator [Pediococcus parvulus]|uniref:XRE family transcriptional regulator n=1 Tax=Pediococcus parvulus TaxID=54062 RepID=UPI00345E5884